MYKKMSTPLYAKIKYYGDPAYCEESTECVLDGKKNPVYSCNVNNWDYCKDFKQNQTNWANWEKSKDPKKTQKIPSPPYYYQGCFTDSNCSSKKPIAPKPVIGSCSVDQKLCCEDMNQPGPSNLCLQYSQCCGVKCIDAEYGFSKSKDPNTCYVGDKDPCNLMDSGEDLVPNTCFNSCCPGNYTPKPTSPPKPKPTTPPKPKPTTPPKCPNSGVIACVRNVDQDNRKVSFIKNMKTSSNNTAVDLCIDKGFLANDYTTDEEAFFATNENVVNDYLNHTNLLPDDRTDLWVTVAKKIMNHQPLNQMEQRVRNLGDVLWCDLINQLKKLDKKRSDYESVFGKVVLINVGRLRSIRPTPPKPSPPKPSPPKPTPPKPSPPKPTPGVIACVRDTSRKDVSFLKSQNHNEFAMDQCQKKGLIPNEPNYGGSDREAFWASNENVVKDYLDHTYLSSDQRAHYWETTAKKKMNHQPLDKIEQKFSNLGGVLWNDLESNLKQLDKYKGTPEYDEYFHNEVLAYVGRY